VLESNMTTALEPQTDVRTEEATPEEVATGYRERALQIMQSLPPPGFERLCQRLLRESGFQQVTVMGRSGDGGMASASCRSTRL
jgi:restriction system protein